MRATETDALTKWCPFTRTYAFAVVAQATPADAPGGRVVPTATGGPANRYINGATVEINPEHCRCIASQCMAWVWVGYEREGVNRLGTCGLAQSYQLMKD